jgi:DNA-binding transcriptional regulator YiaG
MPKRPKVPATLRLFKSARALLGWSTQDVADKTGISRATIMDFESGRGSMTQERVAEITQVFEDAGIKFLRDGIIYQHMDLATQSLTARFEKHWPRLEPHEIRQLREKLGLTQREFSYIVGGGPRAMVKWESGEIRPVESADNLMRLIWLQPALVNELVREKTT